MKVIRVPALKDGAQALAATTNGQAESVARTYRLLLIPVPGIGRMPDARPHIPLRLCERWKIAKHAPIASARRQVCRNAYLSARRQAVWPDHHNAAAAQAYITQASSVIAARQSPVTKRLAALLVRYGDLAMRIDPVTGKPDIPLLASFGMA